RPVAQPQNVGSGVWIGRNGYVATCEHVTRGWQGPFKVGFTLEPYVTEGASNLMMIGNRSVYDAVLVASDQDMDVAILRTDIKPDEIRVPPLATGVPMGSPITPLSSVSPKGATMKTDFPDAGETLLLSGYPIATNESALVLQAGTETGFYLGQRPLAN